MIMREKNISHGDTLAIILMSKKPALDWVNKAGIECDCGDGVRVRNIDEINAEPFICCFPQQDSLNSFGNLVEKSKKELLQVWLESWTADESKWPIIETEVFDAFFNVAISGLVYRYGNI